VTVLAETAERPEEIDISRAEDNEVHQIASELGLDHREYIAARMAWKDRLTLLQDLPKGPAAS